LSCNVLSNKALIDNYQKEKGIDYYYYFWLIYFFRGEIKAPFVHTCHGSFYCIFLSVRPVGKSFNFVIPTFEAMQESELKFK
jgi:hypothetical protein